MTTSRLKLSLLAGALAATGVAHATPIIGSINISGRGNITLINDAGDPGPVTLANADRIEFPVFNTIQIGNLVFPVADHNARVSAGSGDFSTSASIEQLVRQFDFGWNPATTPVTPLWTTVGGAPVWTFELTSITVEEQNANFLNLSGLGYFDDGFADNNPNNVKDRSLGDWTFTVTATQSVFTWTSSDAAPPRNRVPDNGGSFVLLGSALLAAGMFRRKFVA